MATKKSIAAKYSFKANTIYCGDNLEVMGCFPAECVNNIYIDPPFYSKKTYEVIWGDGYEKRSFKDRWEGGIQHYIDWMRPRLEQCHRLLKPKGSMWLHCDYHANAYLRVLMDTIFGYDNLVNEIEWCYNVGGRSLENNFGRKHDTLYWYAKGKDWTFNPDDIRIPRQTGYKSFGGRIVEEGGKLFQIKVSKRKDGSRKEYKYRLDEGKLPEDWWTDINSIQSQSKERLGYPTQKPIALLDRIIRCSSNKGEVWLDGFAGCGTTLEAAIMNGREFVGIDISPTACRLIASRIQYSIGQIIGIPYSADELKALSPFEFQNWVVLKLGGRISARKTSDMGVDGIVPLEGNLPIQVKQSAVSRPEVDKFESAIRRLNKVKGYFVALSFTRGAVEEIARCKNIEGIEIIYLTVEDLVNNITKEIAKDDSNNK